MRAQQKVSLLHDLQPEQMLQLEDGCSLLPPQGNRSNMWRTLGSTKCKLEDGILQMYGKITFERKAITLIVCFTRCRRSPLQCAKENWSFPWQMPATQRSVLSFTGRNLFLNILQTLVLGYYWAANENWLYKLDVRTSLVLCYVKIFKKDEMWSARERERERETER